MNAKSLSRNGSAVALVVLFLLLVQAMPVQAGFGGTGTPPLPPPPTLSPPAVPSEPLNFRAVDLEWDILGQGLDPLAQETGIIQLSWSPPASKGRLPLGPSVVLSYNIHRGLTGEAIVLYDTMIVAGSPEQPSYSYGDHYCPRHVGCHYQVSAVTTAGEGPRSDSFHVVPLPPVAQPGSMRLRSDDGVMGSEVRVTRHGYLTKDVVVHGDPGNYNSATLWMFGRSESCMGEREPQAFILGTEDLAQAYYTEFDPCIVFGPSYGWAAMQLPVDELPSRWGLSSYRLQLTVTDPTWGGGQSVFGVGGYGGNAYYGQEDSTGGALIWVLDLNLLPAIPS